MARVPIAFATVLLTFGMAVTAVAQHTVPPAPGGCGCNHGTVSTQPCDYHGCCPPLLPTIGRGIHDFFQALMPCCCGNNHRAVYHEALRRNGSRSRCCLPLLPLISVRHGCGCGVDPCGCGMGETIQSGPAMMDSFEDPGMSPPQPVPSSEMVPSEVAPETLGIPPQTEQGASNRGLWQSYPASRHRTTRLPVDRQPTPARRGHQQATKVDSRANHERIAATNHSTPGTFTPVGAHRLSTEKTTIRTVSGTMESTSSIPSNPLR